MQSQTFLKNVEIIIINNFKPLLIARWLSRICRAEKFAVPKSDTPSQAHQQYRSLYTHP